VTTGIGFVVAEIEGLADGENGTIEKAGKVDEEGEAATIILFDEETEGTTVVVTDDVTDGTIEAIIDDGKGLFETEAVVDGFLTKGVTVIGVCDGETGIADGDELNSRGI